MMGKWEDRLIMCLEEAERIMNCNEVWEDDPRFRAGPEPVYIRDGQEIRVFTADAIGNSRPLALLIRSGDTLRVLPVKKRRKPLVAGTCLFKDGIALRAICDGMGYRAIRPNWNLAGRHCSTIEEVFGCQPGTDPRDYGWTLVEDNT